MISVNKFKPGISYIDDDNLYLVISAHHAKQARSQASVKAKVKDLRTGAIVVKTYTGGEKFPEAFIEKKEMDFLYSDQNSFYFMDSESYEQIQIGGEKLVWEKNFLREGDKMAIRVFNKEILDVELPINIKLKVEKAPDAIKGNTQNNPQKKAILETGFELEVPMFIKVGETIIISTETGKYVGRSKE